MRKPPTYWNTAKKILSKKFPNLPISISSEVIPEMQEYERAETTVLNSYVRPQVSNYVNNLQSNLEKKLGKLSKSNVKRCFTR